MGVRASKESPYHSPVYGGDEHIISIPTQIGALPPMPAYPYPPQVPSGIGDHYHSLDEVVKSLAVAGLRSPNLIIGIDFAKSNEWSGTRSFDGQNLHHIGQGMNPYEQAISIIGKTLAACGEDYTIHCFGFGDASTRDQDVFSFYPHKRFCNGFAEVLSRYRELVPHVRLAAPTSFEPMINMAMTIVEQSGGQHHVLLIIADDQVTRSVDTVFGQLSPQGQKTVQAIAEASNYPLSIILVGVGDGPWDRMNEFTANIPFVNFTEIMAKYDVLPRKETKFAQAALMHILSQYRATKEMNMLGRIQRGKSPQRVPRPPPISSVCALSSAEPSYWYPEVIPHASSAPPAPSSTYDTQGVKQDCQICFNGSKDMVFGCGHQTCCDCGTRVKECPFCRKLIKTRIKVF